LNLHRLDLNLLVVLHHLLIEKKVTRVAQLLAMSQPAVSSALGRLRLHLNDPLFVRTQAGMEPTPYALALAQPVSVALNVLREALNVRATFDPLTDHRDFVLALSDVGEMYFLPRLVEAFRKQAPFVTLQVERATDTNLREEMEAGRIDLAIGLLPHLQTGFFQQGLFRQRYVGLMRRGHPLAKKGQWNSHTFYAAEHVQIVAAGTGHGKVNLELGQGTQQRQCRLVVPHFVALGDVLMRSNLIATVPERFADCIVKPYSLVKKDLPVTVAQSSIHQFWHQRLHRDPGHQWLRGQVSRLFADTSQKEALVGAQVA
jgi:DNA-binding transcriptional LysR family regulator